MGDYTKLIVSCQVSVPKEELVEKIAQLRLSSSAYHSDESAEVIQPSEWREGCLDLVLVGQTKWGNGQEEFLRWLQPFVVCGSGPGDLWAFQINEYFKIPIMWAMNAERCNFCGLLEERSQHHVRECPEYKKGNP